jgi:hypothetical protein
MLSVGRDVYDLMGVRSLHIIDVRDANGAGKNQKFFGRIFYTEGKSLIFYVFDRRPRSCSAHEYARWSRRARRAFRLVQSSAWPLHLLREGRICVSVRRFPSGVEELKGRRSAHV